MNTVDGDVPLIDVPLGDASLIPSQDAHVQEQHVSDPGRSVAGQILFATVIIGLDRRINPGVPQNLANFTEPANNMMLPNLIASAMETTPSTSAPRQQWRLGAARPKCCAGAHSFETIDC